MTSTTCGSNTSHRPSEDTRGCCGVQAKLSLNKFFDLTVDEFTGMYTALPEADDQQDVAGSLASGSTSRSNKQPPVPPGVCSPHV